LKPGALGERLDGALLARKRMRLSVSAFVALEVRQQAICRLPYLACSASFLPVDRLRQASPEWNLEK
jgi:hypothetical protein